MKGYWIAGMAFILVFFLTATDFLQGLASSPSEQEASVEQKIRQGDPSTALTPAAAGMQTSDPCQSPAYFYGIAYGGFHYVRPRGSDLFAVDSRNGILLLRQQGKNGSYFSLSALSPEVTRLEQVLRQCEAGPTQPTPTTLHFVMLVD